MAMIMYLFAVAITEATTAYRVHHGWCLRFKPVSGSLNLHDGFLSRGQDSESVRKLLRPPSRI